MPAAARIVRRVLRRAFMRLMDRVGGRVVSGMADTSSDAPSATFVPKRNLYEKMRQDEEAREPGG